MTNTERTAIIAGIEQLMLIAHDTAVKHGFWPSDSKGQRNVGEMIALMHAELSEALEAIRTGDLLSDHIPGYTGCEEEMADVLIRVFDFCAGNGLRLAEALVAKLEFNEGRAHKHGKAF